MSFKASLFEVCQQLQFYSDYGSYIKLLEVQPNITEIAYAIHNCDKLNNGEPKAPHIHIMIKCKKVTTSKNIAKIAHVGEEYVQRSAFGSYVLMIQYLTHKNDINKFQYDYDKDVVKVKGDIDKYYNSVNEIITKSAKLDYAIDWTFSNKSYIQQHKEITEFKYGNEKDRINKFRQLEYLFNEHCKEMSYNGSDRNMEIIYITGGSGFGKTELAKFLCKTLLTCDYVISSSSNDPLQDYMGQKCLVLDDFRPTDLKFSDLLKLTDPHTCSTVKSRYSNKYMVDCKYIIITSIWDLNTFANKINQDTQEPIEQLYRRISSYIEVDKEYYYAYASIDTNSGKPIGDPLVCENPCKYFTKQQTSQFFDLLSKFAEENTKDIFSDNNN